MSKDQSSNSLTRLLVQVGTALAIGLAKEGAEEVLLRFRRWRQERERARQHWYVSEEMRSSYYPLDDEDYEK